MQKDDTPRAQPWHPADEKPKSRSAPLGTHSLTGGGASVGMPARPQAESPPERSAARDEPPGKAEPDPLAEPRANLGEILGNKP